MDPAHSPFSQEGPKGLESACTTTKVYDQKSQNFCTQDVQRLLVNSINLTSLQAVTLLGSQKEWEISYSHISFSEDASGLVQIRLKQCCCLVLPFFTLLMCTPTDYPVLDLVTVKLCGEWELPFHWKQIGTKYKMGFFIWISILGRVGRR